MVPRAIDRFRQKTCVPTFADPILISPSLYSAGLTAHDGKDFIQSAVWQAVEITRHIRSWCTQRNLEPAVEGTVRADVLVGQDGRALAIRLVPKF